MERDLSDSWSTLRICAESLLEVNDSFLLIGEVVFFHTEAADAFVDDRISRIWRPSLIFIGFILLLLFVMEKSDNVVQGDGVDLRVVEEDTRTFAWRT